MEPESQTRPTRVAFLTKSLQPGGAERQIATLTAGMDHKRFSPAVFCFYGGGLLEDEVRAAGVPVVDLAKRGRWEVIRFFRRLIGELRRFDPDVLYTFQPVPNIIGVILKRFLPRVRVVWGVRSAYATTRDQGWFSWMTFGLERLLSRFADRIVANSEAARANCRAKGYETSRMEVIPNGINTERFRPNAEARAGVRRELGIADESAIGIAGRLDAVKDHETFLHAAALLCASRSDVRFVIIGGGSESRRAHLTALAEKLGVPVIRTGVRADIANVMNALDILSSTSVAESFPNSVLEAMACGVPCVVTDVGDSRVIVGTTGIVVPPRSPEALAEAWREMLSRPPASREAVRQRIVSNYDVTIMVQRTEDVLSVTASAPQSRDSA